MKTYLLLFLGLAGMIVAGCGGGATGDVDDFINRMALEQCNWEFRCCTDQEVRALDGRKFTTADACGPYRTLALENQLYLERLAARQGRLRVDAQKAARCVEALSRRACGGTVAAAMPPDPMQMDACASVFVGSTSVGDECVYKNECAAGARCVADDTTVGRGVCVPYQKVGDICNADADCDPQVHGLYCNKLDFHCRVRGLAGEQCQYTTDRNGERPSLPLLAECDAAMGFYCDPATSLCRHLPGDGEACLEPPPPGVQGPCDPDPTLQLACTSTGTGGVCHSFHLLDDGAPCQRSTECRSQRCDYDPTGSTLVCQASTTGTGTSMCSGR